MQKIYLKLTGVHKNKHNVASNSEKVVHPCPRGSSFEVKFLAH